MIYALFKLLFFVAPLLFLPFTSDLFELPKMYFIYLMTLLITIAWTAKCMHQKRLIFNKTLLDIPLILFILTTALATVFSIDPYTSFFGIYGRPSNGLLSIILFSILYWAFVSNVNHKHISTLIKTMVVSGIIVAFWATLERFGVSLGCMAITGKINAACWTQDVTKQSFATLGQPNSLGSFMVSLFPVASIIHPLLSTIFYVAIIAANSKASLLGTIVVLVLLTYFFRKQKKYLFQILLSAFAVTLIFGLLWAVNFTSQNNSIYLWEGALKIVATRPILGLGPDTFEQSYFRVRPIAHNDAVDWDLVHKNVNNQYLQIASGSGLLGIATYVAGIVATFLGFWKSKKDKLQIVIFSGWVGILVTNFFGFATSVSQLTFYLFPAMIFAKSVPLENMLKIKKKYLGLGFAMIAVCVFMLVILGAFFVGDLYYTQGNKLANQQKTNEAISYLKKVTNLSPYNPIYWSELAQAYIQVPTTENKIMAYNTSKSSLQLGPKRLDLLKSRASILSELAKTDPKYKKELEEIILMLVKLAPTDPTGYFIAGVYYANNSDPTKSYEMLGKALNLKPNYTRARIAMASLLVNYGKNDEAKKELEKILEYDTENKYVQELLQTIK